MEYSDSREKSEILDIFQGQIFNEIFCPCKHKNYGFENFIAIHLDIPSKSGFYSNSFDPKSTIQESLNKFCSAEELDDSNKYKCLTCKKEQKCKKKSVIYGFPQILIIHLKRFEITNFLSKTKKLSFIKVDGKINLNVRIQNIEKNESYLLFSVVNHNGSIYSGHYTTEVMGIYDKKWYDISDTNVSSSSNPSDYQSSDCYILFYKKIN